MNYIGSYKVSLEPDLFYEDSAVEEITDLSVDQIRLKK
jgi:hypothetical protein